MYMNTPNMRGSTTGGGTAQAKSKVPAPPKLVKQTSTSKEATRIRALFKKKLPDADLDRLLASEPGSIIQIMSEFEVERGTRL